MDEKMISISETLFMTLVDYLWEIGHNEDATLMVKLSSSNLRDQLKEISEDQALANQEKNKNDSTKVDNAVKFVGKDGIVDELPDRSKLTDPPF